MHSGLIDVERGCPAMLVQLVYQWLRILVPLVLKDPSSQLPTLPGDTTVLSRDVLNPAHVGL
jgi:hypothetical protein